MTVDTTPKHDYPGKDLEAMSFAANYHQWILDEFRPYIGKKVAEVGAGSGNFTRMLLQTPLERLIAYEPSSQMFPLLSSTVKDEAKVDTINAFFGSGVEKDFDSIFYVNVLEHVEDDRAELSLMHRQLNAHGHALIFVPALPALLSDFDRSIGHFRRYRKNELNEKFRNAGFSIIKIKYFDIAGILPWYINFILLKKTLSGNSVAAYDRIVVPLMSKIEKRLSPPIGKNLLVIAKKA
jgi:SAM-dependent methyltransferase